jgi:TetR/AcrR family transcriptional regulator
MTQDTVPRRTPFPGGLLFSQEPGAHPLDEHQNRDRILLAAASLFANKGYAGTSVREIVETAGVTKPTLYYYFKNKEELYVRLMDLAVETFCWVLSQSVNRPGTIREQLAGLLADLYGLFREHVDLLRLVNSMFYGPKGATPPYDFGVVDEHFDRVILEKLDSGIQQGELRAENKHLVLLLLGGFIQALEYILIWEPQKADLALKDFRQIISILFDGARMGCPCQQAGAGA